MRTMALELSGTGVRVGCLRTAANPDTRTIQDTADAVGKMLNLTREHVLADLEQGTWLKVSPHTETRQTVRYYSRRIAPA